MLSSTKYDGSVTTCGIRSFLICTLFELFHCMSDQFITQHKPTLPLQLYLDILNLDYFTRILLRLGAQSVKLLSTLRDPTQLRDSQCVTRQ